MPFGKKTNTFDEFLILEDKENKSESMRNYKAYVAGKEPLRHTVINHREGDPVYDFIKSKITRNFSVFPDGHWEKVRKQYRADLEKSMSANEKKFM